MNKGGIVTVDDILRNAGLFARVPRMYGSDDIEVVSHDGREALWHLREAGHTRLSLLCGFDRFLRGQGR